MQEERITDIDGVTRDYGFDITGGYIFLKTDASKKQNPGRPYYFIVSLDELGISARHSSAHGLKTAHQLLWSDADKAKKLLSREVGPDSWMRGAHAG